MKDNTSQNESICANCMKQGTTRSELKDIKFFNPIKVSHFQCSHCNYTSDSISFLEMIQPKGIHIVYHVTSLDDMQKFIIKSGTCVVSIPQLNLEIPGPTQADTYSPIKDFLEQAYKTLNEYENVESLNLFDKCIKGSVKFDLIIDDPTGNSFIECQTSPDKDDKLEITYYERTKENEETIEMLEKRNHENYEIEQDSFERIDSIFANNNNQVMAFQTTCAFCEKEGTMRSCTLAIPHFKEIAIMNYNCDHCGYHKAEVIVCGNISPKARKITLYCDSKADLMRDLLKSETASIQIPEIEFELTSGTLGGKFTTVEGLLVEIQKNLRENNPFTKRYADIGDLSTIISLNLLKNLETMKNLLQSLSMIHYQIHTSKQLLQMIRSSLKIMTDHLMMKITLDLTI